MWVTFGRRLAGPLIAVVALFVVVAAGPAMAGASATPPGKPRSVTAAPGNESIVVSWLAPTSTGGSAITSYTAACKAGSATTSATVAGTVHKATVSGLSNGTAYTCTVVATNASGTGAASAATSSVTPAGPPTAPSSVLVSTKGSTLVVTWKPASAQGSAITGYTVSCPSTDGGGTLGGHAAATAKTLSVPGLPANRTYSCTVSATNAKGTGPAGTSADYAEHAVLSATTTSATLHLPVATGQRATLQGSGDALSSDGCADISISAPAGSSLADGCLYKDETAYVETSAAFTASGTATAVLTPPAGATGSVELAAYAYKDIRTAISPKGPSVQVMITAPGQLAFATFTGKAGQDVSVTADSTTVAGSFDIRDPAGDEIGYAGLFTGQQSFLDTTALPTAGTYTIGVSPGSYATGATTLRLYTVPANTGSITVGGPTVAISLPTPGENATRTFAGTANEHVTLSFTGNTIEGLVDIRDANGNELGYSYLQSGSPTGSFTATLPSRGIYTVLVDGAYAATGKITLKLHT